MASIHSISQLVEGGVLVGDFESGTGTVNAGDVRAARSKVEGEASLVAKNVKGLAVGILGGGGVVLALVEKGSGLLAFERIVMESDAVHGECGGRFARHVRDPRSEAEGFPVHARADRRAR